MTQPENLVRGSGLGIFIPEEIWERAWPELAKDVGYVELDMEKTAYREVSQMIDVRLRDGRIVRFVYIDSTRELFGRMECIGSNDRMTSEGMDFTEDDIAAIGIEYSKWWGFGHGTRWFERD